MYLTVCSTTKMKTKHPTPRLLGCYKNERGYYLRIRGKSRKQVKDALKKAGARVNSIYRSSNGGLIAFYTAPTYRSRWDNDWHNPTPEFQEKLKTQLGLK